MNTSLASKSPASHSFLGMLPSTDCKECLSVRTALGKTIIAVETTLSKLLGFGVGQEIDTQALPKKTMLCLEPPVISAQEIVDYRNRLDMTQEVFAKTFGISLAQVKEWEASPVAA